MNSPSNSGSNVITNVYGAKASFQNLLRPVKDSLVRMHVSANAVTISALILSAVYGSLFLLLPQAIPVLCVGLSVVLFVRMALNAIDGMIARENNQKTRFGCWLNEVGDVISDSVLYLPLVAVPELSSSMARLSVVGIVLLAAVAEMTGFGVQMYGKERDYTGPLTKSDRALLFGFVGVLIFAGSYGLVWRGATLVGFMVLNAFAMLLVPKFRPLLSNCGLVLFVLTLVHFYDGPVFDVLMVLGVLAATKTVINRARVFSTEETHQTELPITDHTVL